MITDPSQVRITVAGTGNVGYHLARQFVTSGFSLVQVTGRREKPAVDIAEELHCGWTTDPGAWRTDVNLIVLAITDQELEKLIATLNFGDALVVHTAGAVPLSVFAGQAKHYGVFYPLQTFSRQRDIDFSGLPCCIEASHSEDEMFLSDIAETLKAQPVRINSQQRAQLHLSAVFVNNFVNHMYVCAEKILDHYELPRELFRPIIRETVEKALAVNPENAQTGPAQRKEENVIKKHLELLSFSPQLEKLYSTVTESIRKAAEENVGK